MAGFQIAYLGPTVVDGGGVVGVTDEYYDRLDNDVSLGIPPGLGTWGHN